MKLVSVDELEGFIGKEMGTGDWFQIDQSQIDQFADVTKDHQFIHVDEELAKPIFGGTIAHGFLTLSMLVHLKSSVPDTVVPKGVTMGMNYGFDKVRFLQPVKRGSKVRAKVVMKSVNQKRPGQILVSDEFTVEIEGEEKPALVAEWLTMYFVS